MAPNQKFTISLIYTKTAFPELNISAPVEGGEGTGGGLGAGWIILIIIVVLVVIVVLIVWVTSDDYGGGYTSGGGGSSGSSSVLRSGGGSGGFSGRGSSCACVSSCACACACAGGGRVGCSLRRIGIDISSLLNRRKSGGDCE